MSGTTFSYTLAADVGLLTRNIKIIGQDYPTMMQDSFGARLLVGTYSWQGINYKGKKRHRPEDVDAVVEKGLKQQSVMECSIDTDRGREGKCFSINRLNGYQS